MIINRRVTRTILNSTETTSKTQSLNTDALAFELQTSDVFYLGFYGKYASRHFNFKTANTNPAVLSVEYYDGTTWQAVEDLIDETEGFTKSGFLHWNNKTDWTKTSVAPVDDTELFYVRVKTDTNLSVGTELESVVSVFSNDDLLKVFYPELVSDTRWYPPNRTDYLEQHLKAKDRVVLRMKQRNLIDDESQVIDVNDVSLAAVHACAYIILFPIATSDEFRDLRDDAEKEFSKEINNLKKSVDADKSGTVTQSERSTASEFDLVRR